jgi:hypothetical protein
LSSTSHGAAPATSTRAHGSVPPTSVRYARFPRRPRCSAAGEGAESAAQTNRPFEGTTSIPIHPATLRDMLAKRSVTSAVVLQALAWLGRTPESFLTSPPTFPAVPLPDSGPGHVLRFDTRAMHAALNAQRQAQGLSWAQVAAELPGFTPSMLTNLATGPLIGFPRVMLLTQWLGRPVADFVRVSNRCSGGKDMEIRNSAGTLDA